MSKNQLSSSNFKNMMAEVKKHSILANQDPDQGDLRTLSAKRGMIKNAREKILDIKNQIRLDILNNGLFILATGAGAEQFVDIAQGEFNTFSGTGNVTGLVDRVIKDINPILYTDKRVGPSLVTTIAALFESIASDIGMVSYPIIYYKQQDAVNLTGKESFHAFVQKLLLDHLGPLPFILYQNQKIVDKVIETMFDATMVPVTLASTNPTMTMEIENELRTKGAKVFIVDTKEEVTSAEVEKVLKQIKKNLK